MTIKWRGPITLASIMALLVVAGCGSDDKDSSNTGTASASAQVSSTESTPSADSSATTESTDDPTPDNNGSASDEEFCTKLQQVGEDMQNVGADASDPSKLGDTFRQLADSLKSVPAPAEIADQWNMLTDLYSQFAETFKDVDMSDPDSVSKITDDMSKISDKQQDILKASTALSQYATKHCAGIS